MTPVWSDPQLDKFLSSDLVSEPADPIWRSEYAPQLSYGRHAGPPRADARLAAVAIVLCWDGREWSLPLTVRSSTMRRHSGQISLPGGLVEGDEMPLETARRELTEELGQNLPLDWLGEFAPLFVYASNAYVAPCIACVSGWPDWQPQLSEVDSVLRLRIRELVESSAPDPLVIERGSLQFAAPRFLVDGQSVSGATAVLLAELRGRLRRIQANANLAATSLDSTSSPSI
jgi:8-oxo-dGTP pyrophosphatase MutT (NUDIX family)